MSAIVVVPAAKELGGALVRIMGDRTELERFIVGDANDDLIFSITKVVIENPDLNTDQRIGALLWVASFHGEVIDQWLVDLYEEYASEDILLVMDFLYEIAIRTQKGGLNEETVNIDSRESVVSLLDFLKVYEDFQEAEELKITSVPQFASVVDKLGGLNAVMDIDTRDTLEGALYNTDE